MMLGALITFSGFLSFLKILSSAMSWNKLIQTGKLRLRKPASAPLEANVSKIRAYTMTKIQTFEVANFMELNDYIYPFENCNLCEVDTF